MKTYEQYTGNGSGLSADGRDPADIQRDLQRIRAEMNETLDQLQEKISPGELLDQLLHKARDLAHGSGDFFAGLGRTLKDNPLPVTLIGAGLAYLAYSESSSRRRVGQGATEAIGPWDRDEAEGSRLGERIGHGAEALRDKARGMVSAAKDRLHGASEGAEGGDEDAGPGAGERIGAATEHARERLGAATGHARERAHELAGEARHKVGEVTRQARARAGDARRWVGELWQEHPLVLGLFGVAVGAVLAAGVPTTRGERRAQGRLRQRVQPVIEQAEQAVSGSRGGQSEGTGSEGPEPPASMAAGQGGPADDPHHEAQSGPRFQALPDEGQAEPSRRAESFEPIVRSGASSPGFRRKPDAG